MKKFLTIVLLATLLYGCDKLDDESRVKDVVTIMDDSVFINYCLLNFDLNNDGAISQTEAKTVKVIEITDEPKLKSVKGISAFSNLEEIYFKETGLRSIDLSKNTKLTTIAGETFRGCTSLTSVTIPNSVTSIGNEAFYWCTSLTGVTIPNSVTSIGESAFYKCTSLTSVTIPNSVTSIGYNAFYNCSGRLTINSKIIETDYTYNNCPSSTWWRCSIFTELVLGDNIEKIGSYAFYDCSSHAIAIPDSVTSIGDSAFSYFGSLTNVTIPNSVTSIGKATFRNCSSLTSVTIPDSVTSIGYSAFSYCGSLTSVYCKPTTPPAGGNLMFHYIASGYKIYVPTASVNAYKSAKYWSNYADAIVGYDF